MLCSCAVRSRQETSCWWLGSSLYTQFTPDTRTTALTPLVLTAKPFPTQHAGPTRQMCMYELPQRAPPWVPGASAHSSGAVGHPRANPNPPGAFSHLSTAQAPGTAVYLRERAAL